MRSDMCALAGTTGRIQTSKICRCRATFGIGEELEHPARKRLDVGVVAVVHAAHLADALVAAGPRRCGARPSQARAIDSAAKSGCARVTSIGKPNEIAGGARVLLEDLHLDARRAGTCTAAVARAAGSGRQRVSATRDERAACRRARRRSCRSSGSPRVYASSRTASHRPA